MKDRHDDIKDDEIRVISSGVNNARPPLPVRSRGRRLHLVLALAGVIVVAVVCILIFGRSCGKAADDDGAEEVFKPLEQVNSAPGIPCDSAAETAPVAAGEKACTVRTDTLVNGHRLVILSPRNAEARFVIGHVEENDSTVILVAQAADVRGDNGEIAGSCVLNGELVSKGEAKSGFCSIIGGEIKIGVADASPALEEALQAGGSFFRQYPLVVGGQIVENRPKGRSVRKALAELNGEICMIISLDRLTFHDFSETLVDLGVRNAIYLVGGKSFGLYTDAEGERVVFGQKWEKEFENVNYIVWRRK